MYITDETESQMLSGAGVIAASYYWERRRPRRPLNTGRLRETGYMNSEKAGGDAGGPSNRRPDSGFSPGALELGAPASPPAA